MFEYRDIDMLTKTLSEPELKGLVQHRVAGIAAEVELVSCGNRGDRVGKLPLLNPAELEELKNLTQLTSDGYVISKITRDSLYRRGLIIRWNGWNLISRLGLIVLDTLGLTPHV
jgi:hypothetical protein